MRSPGVSDDRTLGPAFLGMLAVGLLRDVRGKGMLILTRKVDQGIVIQGNILVTVLRVEKDRVKLGISAPNEITVLRDELVERNGRDQSDRRDGQNEEVTEEQPE
jgi:carbon storage regulator